MAVPLAVVVQTSLAEEYGPRKTFDHRICFRENGTRTRGSPVRMLRFPAAAIAVQPVCPAIPHDSAADVSGESAAFQVPPAVVVGLPDPRRTVFEALRQPASLLQLAVRHWSPATAESESGQRYEDVSVTLTAESILDRKMGNRENSLRLLVPASPAADLILPDPKVLFLADLYLVQGEAAVKSPRALCEKSQSSPFHTAVELTAVQVHSVAEDPVVSRQGQAGPAWLLGPLANLPEIPAKAETRQQESDLS